MSESPPPKASPASGPSLKARKAIGEKVEKIADEAALKIIEARQPASVDLVDGNKGAKVGLGEEAGDEKENPEALKALMDAKEKIDRELVKLPESATDLWEQFWERLFNRLMEGRFNLFQITRDHPNKIIKFLGAGFPGMAAEKILPYLKKWLDKKAGHTPAEGDAVDPSAANTAPAVSAGNNTVDPKLSKQLNEAERAYAAGKTSGVGNGKGPSKKFTPSSDAAAGGSAAKPPGVPLEPVPGPEPEKPKL